MQRVYAFCSTPSPPQPMGLRTDPQSMIYTPGPASFCRLVSSSFPANSHMLQSQPCPLLPKHIYLAFLLLGFPQQTSPTILPPP